MTTSIAAMPKAKTHVMADSCVSHNKFFGRRLVLETLQGADDDDAAAVGGGKSHGAYRF